LYRCLPPPAATAGFVYPIQRTGEGTTENVAEVLTLPYFDLTVYVENPVEVKDFIMFDQHFRLIFPNVAGDLRDF
jgi:hypothetical protein